MTPQRILLCEGLAHRLGRQEKLVSGTRAQAREDRSAVVPGDDIVDRQASARSEHAAHARVEPRPVGDIHRDVPVPGVVEALIGARAD